MNFEFYFAENTNPPTDMTFGDYPSALVSHMQGGHTRIMFEFHADGKTLRATR